MESLKEDIKSLKKNDQIKYDNAYNELIKRPKDSYELLRTDPIEPTFNLSKYKSSNDRYYSNLLNEQRNIRESIKIGRAHV